MMVEIVETERDLAGQNRIKNYIKAVVQDLTTFSYYGAPGDISVNTWILDLFLCDSNLKPINEISFK